MHCMIRNLDITLLRTFVAVADHGSMTVGGNALHLTQSAVSQQIARLEALSGVLFFREKRILRLTPGGERLLGKARHLITLNDELWAEMTEGPLEGVIRLGAPYDLVGAWLPPALKNFAAAHSQVDLQLICMSSPELLAATAAGTLDLALVEEPPGKSAGECLSVDRLVWVGAKGGAAFLKRPLPVSMVAETCAFRSVVLQALRKKETTWQTLFESGSIDATLAMVRSDLAVSVLLASTIPGDLTILPFDENLPELPLFSVNLYHVKGQRSRASNELAQQLRDGLK
ncbi:LysR family transcriptional regulator [Erwinia typographi]|uniref:LysR family transcriptional regulator n=2 Tax=Erwinia typographi TaxID=371042 RepID=A0A0A3YHJ4_9GAMM|nr:LysR family transcriptional regulator [Erwinia typographi]